MALKGDTSNLLLADIFQTLFQNGQSGVLELRSATERRRVAFASHGVTLLDARAFRAERLGHLCVAGNLVPQPKIDAALAEVLREGDDPFSSIKLLVVLDENGALPLQQGVGVLRTEVREELFEVFTLERMEFEFFENDVPQEGIPRECFFRPEEVVMEAARRVDEWGRIRDVVGTGDRYYVAAPEIDATGIEGVVERLDGSNTTRDIAEALLVSRFEVARVVWQLLEANQLRPATVEELLRAARSLDPQSARARIEQIVRRFVTMVDDSDERLDDAAEIAIAANVRDLAIELLVRRARALFAGDHPEAAYAGALRARDIAPTDRRVLELLADIHHSRGERDAEVKVLTMLAERAAAEKQFDVAVDCGARVAAIRPDSPLLDHAFVIHCQNANRVAYGVEVLARAAGQRSSKAGVAALYRSILTLDPLRGDVRKMLGRVESRRRRGRLVAIAGGLLLLPILGFGVQIVLDRFERQHIRGQVEAADRLVADGEWKAARSTLDAIAGAEVDDDTAMTIVRLRRTVDEKLAERAEQTKARTIQTTREDLSAVQDALGQERFATALDALLALQTTGDDGSREPLVVAKRKVLANAIAATVTRLEASCASYREPEDETGFAAVLDRFGAEFSQEREDEFVRLGALAERLATEVAWKDLAPKIATDATRGLAAITTMRPRILDAEARRARAAELDLLSGDYEAILAAEARGDYSTAAEGYSRLLREYGEGTLTRQFADRKEAATTIAAEVTAIQDLANAGTIEDAAARTAALFARYPDLPLANTIGTPRLVESIPTGASIAAGDTTLGHTPLVVFAKGDAPLALTIGSTGFETRALTVAAAASPRVLAELRRDRRFEIELAAPFDVAPVTNDRFVFLGGRDGVVRRLRRADGAVDGEVRTDSLAGACAAPLLVAGTLVVAMGEGTVFGIDPEAMTVRFRAVADARLVGSMLADDGRILAITERGELLALDVSSGELRSAAWLDVAPRTGPVRSGSMLAVGTADGELVAFSAATGAIVFRTPKSRHPASGVVALANRFILATDDGTIRAFDATNGDAEWSHSTAAAFAAAPLAQDGLLLIAAGEHAIVLDGETGSVRCEVVARDWLAAPLALAGGRLYACDRSGALDVFDLTAATRLFRHSLGSPARAQPVVLAEGVLIVTENGTVSIVGS